MIEAILLALSASYMASQLFAIWKLRQMRQDLIRDAQHALPLASYPSISIITSLKGPTPYAAESVRSLLAQDYPGELELVFAVKDKDEPLLAQIQDVVAESKTLRQLKWVYPVAVTELNPRTAKIAAACDAASGSWIFATTVDTRFPPGFLRRGIETARANPMRFVTAFPVIDGPADFAAALEALGLNVDVSQYFLFTTLAKKPCAYGGAMLFSRELLNKSGGYRAVLRLLADDITLAQAFADAGAQGLLSSDIAYVRQEKHSFGEYWARQVRWRMIARYFLPTLFWLTPLAWTQLYLAIGAICFRSPTLLAALFAIAAARIAVGFATQEILATPRSDWRKAWVMPLHDCIAIAATTAALFKTKIRWGTTEMKLNSGGAVVATRSLQRLQNCDVVGRKPNVSHVTAVRKNRRLGTVGRS